MIKLKAPTVIKSEAKERERNKRFKRRSIRRFVVTEKAPTRAFSCLKVPNRASTFKTLLRHYAKQMLTHGKYRVSQKKCRFLEK